MRVKLSVLGLYNYDPTIFDGFQVPEGVDRQRAIDTIITDLAELSLVFTDPDTMRHLIPLWSGAQLDNWNRMYRALSEEYNPLHNYDRYEDWEDNATAAANGSNKQSKAGFNKDAGLADTQQDTQETSSKADTKRKGHLYGNIGVTTSAQMLEGEISVRDRFNIYDIICNSFKRKFCVMIY